MNILTVHMDEHKKTQDRSRQLVVRHFDEACRGVLAEGETVTVEELQRRLQEKYGVKCRPETIARIASSLAREHGTSPLETYYEINADYFQRVGRHCPGTPRAWKKYMASEEELDQAGPPEPSPPEDALDPGRRRKQTEYNTRYIKAMRGLPQYISRLLEDHQTLTVDDFVSDVRADSGIQLKPQTVRSRLARYIQDARGPPYLEEIEDGVYRRSEKGMGSPTSVSEDL